MSPSSGARHSAAGTPNCPFPTSADLVSWKTPVAPTRPLSRIPDLHGTAGGSPDSPQDPHPPPCAQAQLSPPRAPGWGAGGVRARTHPASLSVLPPRGQPEVAGQLTDTSRRRVHRNGDCSRGGTGRWPGCQEGRPARERWSQPVSSRPGLSRRFGAGGRRYLRAAARHQRPLVAVRGERGQGRSQLRTGACSNP